MLHPEVEATNNRSERQARSEAMARKESRTSKTESGAKRRGIIMSLLASLSKRLEQFTLSNVLSEITRWFETGVTVHGAAGDWSIFRPVQAFWRERRWPKTWTCPPLFRAVNGYETGQSDFREELAIQHQNPPLGFGTALPAAELVSYWTACMDRLPQTNSPGWWPLP